jgi:predicted HTH transcriptional regulator
MNYLILIIVGVMGIALGAYFGVRGSGCAAPKTQKSKTKRKKQEKILEFLRENGEVRNNDVEKLLGVSDSTAERYLDELEKEGTILQNGITGRSVFYTLK